MSRSVKEQEKRLPRFALVSDEAAERVARSTQRGAYGLSPAEKFWQERQPLLQKRGYELRPRYSQQWQPSWLGTNRTPIFCEDSIVMDYPEVMDARRVTDGKLLAIKTVEKDCDEVHIAEYLSSLNDIHNHCVPVFDVFPDPLDIRRSFLVMPYLRPCIDPEFCTVGEVIDFVEQTLQGLAFMHRNSIAHRDVSTPNIMMDAGPLYPNGYHPVKKNYTPDVLYRVTPLSRADHPVQYYYIDYGLSTRFPPGSSTLVTGDVGRDRDVPEMSDDVPYDAFKVDIYSLGHIYSDEFEQKYNSMEFLQQLIGPMMQEQPELRPSMEEILVLWNHIKSTLTDSLYRWRLGSKSEPAIERAFNNTVAVAWEGFYHLRKLVS